MLATCFSALMAVSSAWKLGGEFASGITQHPASSSGSDGAITTPAPPFFLLSWTEPSV